ncbi:MAG: hypothetical protein NDF55_10360 [archaeon GB-1867-005]|nr:hypothetical protein [Candidatus Culexmicrobium cathedralense]
MSLKNLAKDIVLNVVYMLIDSYSSTPKITLPYEKPEAEEAPAGKTFETEKMVEEKPLETMAEHEHEVSSTSSEAAFTRDEAAEYTRRMALEHLVASEDHLRAAKGEEAKLCVACLVENHFPALRMYAKEGKKFCRTPEECAAYDKLAMVINDVEKKLLEGYTNFEELANEIRAVRKELSPAIQAIKAIQRTIEEMEKSKSEIKLSPVVRIVNRPSCISEVKEKIEKIMPKVIKAAADKGFRLKPVELVVQEGVVVKDGFEACAATNPDLKPVKQLYNCECWETLSEKEKEKIVAHELAHALGVKDENLAEEIARKAVGQ